MDAATLSAAVKHQAENLGFALSGIAPAAAPAGASRFMDWLEAGYAGEMHYLNDRAHAYRHPEAVLAGVKSLVMLALPYRTTEPLPLDPGAGRVSRYAWNQDYHDLAREKLHALADWLRGERPGAQVRGVIDTAPLLEREFAQLAGLGWVGKNTLLLNRQWGSWFFLAALLTDQELAADEPHAADHCGTCRACLDACPTQAFVAPWVLDATKCISYLTIELRGPIPTELRPGMHDWVFGCDVCQDVCPWNRAAPTTPEPAFHPHPDQHPLALAQLFFLDEAAFRARFRGTPLWRPKRRGLLRNAAIVLGNQRAHAAAPALLHGLADDEPLVRGACAWALGQLGGNEIIAPLSERLAAEIDPHVRDEITAALAP